MVDEPVVMKRLRGKRILFVDDHDGICRSVTGRLKGAGFEQVEAVTSSEAAWKSFDRQHPDLVLMDIHLQEFEGDGLTLLQAFFIHDFRGLAAVVSADRSVEQVYRALAAGANDYWVKGAYFNPVFEVIDLFERPVPEGLLKWEPENIARLGFFRTCGATPKEIESVVEFAKRFSKYGEIAELTNSSYQQLRRTYSRVKQKVGCTSLADFGRLVTLCELMCSRPRPW